VAHQCGKIEAGDEIVQVNYQTVVSNNQIKYNKLVRYFVILKCLFRPIKN